MCHDGRKQLIPDEAGRFVIIGIANSVIAYAVGVGAYLLLAPVVHVVVIGLLASTVSIVISYVNQRVWVFRSTDAWWPQLRRSFVVYGVLSAFGVVLFWALLELIGLSIWISQAVVIVVPAALSYAGQRWFTFRKAGSG